MNIGSDYEISLGRLTLPSPEIGKGVPVLETGDWRVKIPQATERDPGRRLGSIRRPGVSLASNCWSDPRPLRFAKGVGR